jgi:superfamily I DNA and RNA helicase
MKSKVVVVRGTNSKPVSSQSLAKLFAVNGGYQGELFIGYPIIGTPEGAYPIDALWVSPKTGIVIFDLIEGSDPDDFQERQDDAANKLEAKLRAHRELTEKRALLVPIHTLSFAPGIGDMERYSDEEYPLCNVETLQETLTQFKWKQENGLYTAALSAIQSMSTIRKSRSKRIPKREDSRGAKLKRLEDSIATLDSLQSKAVIETVDGVQRIRGLAGSGKTIVLALKAAYLYAHHRDWRIAVTFNTRSLKDQFRRLINTFSVEQTGEEPDWKDLRILNAWGAPGGGEREGVYHEFCRAHDLPYYDFQSARTKFGRGNEFGGACEEALKNVQRVKSLYNVILVDEAQDFSPAFLRLCYEFLDEHKRLVYAYDELQNLSGETMSSPEDTFGKNPDGTPRVRFEEPQEGEPRRDITLEKCYRNSRPVLVTAHALGFGIYRKPARRHTTGLVQMFDHPHLWKEIGYQVKEGELKEGGDVVLRRTEESSPTFLEDHSSVDDLVEFLRFDSEEEQTDWLVEAIKENLEKDELRHDDIIVVNPDPISTRNKVGPIRRRLLEMGINSHLAGVDTSPDIFFETDAESITFTGIYRAKGNEAGMVYIINGQDCQSATWNLASIRNRLFTAITRSKAWVRVLGIGEGMDRLIEEFSCLQKGNFELHFRYPTEDEREHLKIVHRDMTTEQRKRITNRERVLASLVEDIEAGKVHPEDLDDALIQKLGELLKRAK